MRQWNFVIFLIVITVINTTLYLFPRRNECITGTNTYINKSEKYIIKNQSPDNYTRCLLHMHAALNSLSIPWFLTYGTALMYWRSKNFTSHDIDIGVFYKDFQTRNYSEKYFISIMKEKFNFTLRFNHGKLDYGKEWTFICPIIEVKMDIFFFYPLNGTNLSAGYWTATYFGLCDSMINKTCRWKFSAFNLTAFEMYGKTFYVVPVEYLIEHYGSDYMIPKTYGYFESLYFLPNLIREFNNRTTTRVSRKTKTNR